MSERSDIRRPLPGKYERRFRRKKKQRFFNLATFCLILLVFSLALFHLISGRRPQPRFMFLTKDSLSRELEVQALIVRDETVYRAPVSGVYRSFVPQGSKVAKNAKVGQILPVDKAEDMRLLNKAENDVNDYRLALLAEGKAGNSRRIFEASNEEIYRSLSILYDHLIQDDQSKSAEIEAELRRTLQQRVEDVAAFDFHDEDLNQLIAERDRREQKLADSMSLMRSEVSGIYIRHMDGLESSLSPGILSEISVPEIRDAFKMPAPQLPSDMIEAGDPVFKLIRSIYQYLVFEDPSSSFDQSDELRKQLRVYCPANGVTLKNCLVTQVRDLPKGTITVLRTSAAVDAFAAYRSIPLTLYLDEQEGLRVPKSVFMDYEPGNVEASLKIVNGGYVHAVKVKITAENPYYALIEPLENSPYPIEVSTMVVLDPASVPEGEALGNTQ